MEVIRNEKSEYLGKVRVPREGVIHPSPPKQMLVHF